MWNFVSTVLARSFHGTERFGSIRNSVPRYFSRPLGPLARLPVLTSVRGVDPAVLRFRISGGLRPPPSSEPIALKLSPAFGLRVGWELLRWGRGARGALKDTNPATPAGSVGLGLAVSEACTRSRSNCEAPSLPFFPSPKPSTLNPKPKTRKTGAWARWRRVRMLPEVLPGHRSLRLFEGLKRFRGFRGFGEVGV